LKSLIVTADDFGAAREVNEAVERAHRGGILTAASLMVSAPAAADAVARAKEMPKLGVGLHVVLVEGRPTLPSAAIPALVDRDGFFRNDMALQGARMYFLPHVRRQLAAEIDAQFKAFAATGLKLDHVNAHKHFHLHPTIASLIVKIGRRFGMKSLRVPYEAITILRTIEPGTRGNAVAALYARRLKKRLARWGLFAPDNVFGLAWSGDMTTERLCGLIAHLPDGVSEIYMHPATAPYAGAAQGYRYGEEPAAVTSPQVLDLAREPDIRLGPFASFVSTG